MKSWIHGDRLWIKESMLHMMSAPTSRCPQVAENKRSVADLQGAATFGAEYLRSLMSRKPGKSFRYGEIDGAEYLRPPLSRKPGKTSDLEGSASFSRDQNRGDKQVSCGKPDGEGDPQLVSIPSGGKV